jgi:hypothetical protein
MRYKGAQLIFISQINRDGSGVEQISEGYLKILQKEVFEVIGLSLSQNTYIAHGFNAFVVRIRESKGCILYNDQQECPAVTLLGAAICWQCVHGKL